MNAHALRPALLLLLLLPLALGGCALAPRDDATAALAARTAARALDWLWSQQSADGRLPSTTYGVLRAGWSLTATALAATAQLPEPMRAPHAAAIARAVACLRAATAADGSIGLDSDAIDYPTYTSSHWLQALVRLQPDGFCELAAQQVERLRRVQLDESLGWRPDDEFYGAFGFGIRREQAPLSGLVDIALQRTVLEALRGAGVPADDPTIVRAAAFVVRCQQPDGGFCFTPDPDLRRSKAGEEPAADGGVRPRSYGTTTADGLRALRACGRGEHDPAVAAARAWLAAHAATLPVPGLPLDAEPPVEPALRFYWWSTLAFVPPTAALRAELVHTIAARQRGDGAFAGDSDRMKEDDPLVATCLALFALAPALAR